MTIKRRKEPILKTCKGCGAEYYVPPCRYWRDNYCNQSCYHEKRKKECENRAVSCDVCNKSFIPRKTQLRNGWGKYCSIECRHLGRIGGTVSDESKKRISEAQQRLVAEGRKPVLCGPKNPNWKGGVKAAQERFKKSGKKLENTRRYRNKNPEKVREFTQNRNRRKYGRLPKGTVAKIKEWQRYKCAICCVKLPKSYHVDHITPLARGGKHEKSNIQLLCPTCNVRKAAKDPIDYMQEQGMLL